MPVFLDALQQQVEQHFANLSRTRKNPVFALEHGLSSEDLHQVELALRSRCRSRLFPSSDWLFWVIYAAEVGYTYTGDEYWPSFEKETPGWELDDRGKIKRWFIKFQETYNGVKPSGPWAEQFHIIAQPITHAILPRYLQYQIAKALYNLRYSLARMAVPDPGTIGKLFINNAHMPTTRFQEFLQQEELVGRIVLALLQGEAIRDSQLIHHATLQRILEDLEKTRESREWLKETRLVLDQFKGIGHGLTPRDHPSNVPPGADIPRLAIRPKIMLRHGGKKNWSVILDIPSFQGIFEHNTEAQSFLKNTRCHLNGGSEMKPGGWLLSGNRKGVVQTWPDAAKPLIQFEEPHHIVDQLLADECLPNPGPWLFRIGTDGIAREIATRTVRPNYDYIVVTTQNLPQPHESMSSCNLDCEGVQSFRLAIPSKVSTDMTSWLNEFGLQVARTIHVWPAGLPSRGWDGEGNGEWLSTEAPCFGMFPDHCVNAYAFRLNDGAEEIIQTNRASDPVFIRLPLLAPGTHSLAVRACRDPDLDAVASTPPAEGFVQLSVRDPEPWARGIALHPGLIVTIDPNDSDLDTFWQNKTRLFVIGPEGYTATLSFKLETAHGEGIFMKVIGAPFELPITPEKWRQSFRKFLNKNEVSRYLEATTGTLIIDGETLGCCSLAFTHDLQPLRWQTRRDHNDIFIKLLDDTGQEDVEIKVYCCSMEQPLKILSLQPESVLLGRLKVAPPGKLFVAERAGQIGVVAVSINPTDLQDIGLTPRVDKLSRNPKELIEVLYLLSNWQKARASGFASGFLVIRRYCQVINTILVALYEALCGPNWKEIENRFWGDPKSQRNLDALKRGVDKNRSSDFVSSLLRGQENIEGNPAQRINWFSEVVRRTLFYRDSELCEFALRLASQPHKLSTYSFDKLDAFLSEIISNPKILRGARLLALLTTNDAGDDTALMLPGWQW